MEKIIEIDIADKYDLVEKYNDKLVSKELINYILSEAENLKKKDNVKFVITKKFPTAKSCKPLIVQGLKNKYNESLKMHHLIDLKQYLLFIWGAIALVLSYYIDANSIWKEVFAIFTWIPIWELIDLEIFSDAEERKKRKIIKLLLDAEFIEE